METQWICDRATLRTLLRQHPNWTNPHYAQAIGRKVALGQAMETTAEPSSER